MTACSSNRMRLFLHAIDEQEVLRVVNNFKGKYSTDYDGIDMYIIKRVIFYIVKPLTQICNRSFRSGVFPDKMKVAKVIPLFKSGDKRVFQLQACVTFTTIFKNSIKKILTSG